MICCHEVLLVVNIERLAPGGVLRGNSMAVSLEVYRGVHVRITLPFWSMGRKW